MTPILAEIGVTALYLLFSWLAIAIACGWLAKQSGFQEKTGLATGMIFYAAGLVVWIVIWAGFAKEGSARKPLIDG